MDLELADKVAVVTGASKGIGLAVTQELAREGALVIAGARSVAPLEGIENVTPFPVDLTDPAGPADLVGAAIERHGRIDVLVNNVGGVHLRLEASSARPTRTSRRRLSSTSSPPCARHAPR